MSHYNPTEYDASVDAQIERASDAKIEKHFRSHREIPNGRTFLFNRTKDRAADRKYCNNFDKIFKNSPGFGF